MKTITTVLTFFIAIIAAYSQPFTSIDGANINARIHGNGELFQDKQNLSAAFEVPKNSGNHAMFASALWFSSVETKNGRPNYISSHESYGSSGHFKTGPVDIVNQIADQNMQFQRLWKLTKSEIDQHIQNWQNSGYSVPNNIATWPGNGGANNASKLAPFKDLDNDNIYEPQDGEYPLIKGDQAVYLIANDYRPDDSTTVQLSPGVDSTVSYNQSTKSEIHMMLYVYYQNNTDILNTLFVNVKLINRSNSATDNFSDFKAIVFSDMDLGNPFDDYVGTDTIRNMYYGYNGDNFDEAFAGTPGYGNNLPALGVKFLDADIRHSLYFNIGGGLNGDPNNFIDFSNYQRSKWKDGSDVKRGGNGLNSSCVSNTSTKFMYDGNPSLTIQNGEWTELNPCINGSQQPNSPNDRRMIGGPELPTTYGPGDTIEFDYAYIFAQKMNAANPGEAVAELFKAADTVQAFYDNNVVTGLADATKSDNIDFEVYPNPADEKIRVLTQANDFTIEILSTNGSLVNSFKNQKEINLDQLAKGIYFIKLKTDESQKVKKLIVK
jgi:hypothetical protein